MPKTSRRLHSEFIQNAFETHSASVPNSIKTHSAFWQDTFAFHSRLIQNSFGARTELMRNSFIIHVKFFRKAFRSHSLIRIHWKCPQNSFRRHSELIEQQLRRSSYVVYMCRLITHLSVSMYTHIQWHRNVSNKCTHTQIQGEQKTIIHKPTECNGKGLRLMCPRKLKCNRKGLRGICRRC